MITRPLPRPFILLMAILALTGEVNGEPSARPYYIPAQSLNTALMQFAAKANLELLYPADKLRPFNTDGISGSMTAAQALSKLLQGSGMTFRFVDAGTVTIEQAKVKMNVEPEKDYLMPVVQVTANNPQDKTEDGQLMPKVTVEADAEQEYDPEYYADPYNKDYVLPQSSFGTKTDTPVMETPLNVQTVSKGIMKDQQAVTLKDVFRNVSGVSANANSNNTRGNNNNITLRGFNESANISRNGIRLDSSAGSARQLANVESVDVLKGPAAILMGLVEPGGMVNVNTKQALATPYYGLTQQFGSYDFYRTSLDATGPLNKAKDLLYRVNLSYENSGSFRDFVGNEDVFLAPVFKWVISPKTQITFEMEYDHQHEARDVGFFIPRDSDGNLVIAPISRNYIGYDPTNSERIFGSFNWSHQFNDDWTVKHRFSVDYNQGELPFFIVPDHITNNKIISALFQNYNESTTYNTTLDLTGHFDTLGLKHTLLMGGDYYRNESYNVDGEGIGAFGIEYPIDIHNPVVPGFFYKGYNFDTGTFSARSLSYEALTGPLPPYKQLLKETSHIDQFGAYIQDQIKLPHDVHVTGGIRYQYIHQVQTVDVPSPAAKMDHAVTPRVGILWQPKSWLSFYATYTESFGANFGLFKFVSTGKDKLLDPTSAENYEGGIKTEFFNGKLRATFSYFDLTKTNTSAQDPDSTHFCPQGGGFCAIEIGAVRSRGPELDIQGEILPGWNLVANWSNTDIRVEKSGLSSLPEGARLFGVARNNARLWSTYEIQSGDFQGLSFGGGLNFANGITDTDNKVMPGYVTADLQARYSHKLKDATLTFQLNVNNLLDKHYLTSYFPSSEPNSIIWQGIGTPRTLMGQVSVQY